MIRLPCSLTNLKSINCWEELLRKNGTLIDYRSKKVKTGSVDVSFKNLPSDCVVGLSVIKLPVGSLVYLRAEWI